MHNHRFFHAFRNQSVFRILTVTAVLLIISSCSRNPSAIILWSENPEELPHGSLLSVVSQGQDSSIVFALDDSEQRNISVHNWRIRIFEDEDEARAFYESYKDYAGTSAVSKRNALPVRAAANSSGRIVYRLHFDEEIKILDQGEEPSVEGGMEDFWYRILTHGGVEGYVFGFHLQLVDPGAVITEEREGLLDEQLQHLLLSDWRPLEYLEMIRNQRIRPERISARNGLFFDTDEQRIDIVTHSNSWIFAYDSIQTLNSRSYLFTGADITVQFREHSDIQVQFPDGGRQNIERFVILEEDLREIVDAEFSRRDNIFRRLKEQGNQLDSTAYGTIVFQEAGFTWEGFQRLQPRIIPSTAGNEGNIDFGYYMSRNLSTMYDGVMGLSFSNTREQVVFLYELVGDGLRLTHAPENTIRDRVVESVSLSPTILFFTYSTTVEEDLYQDTTPSDDSNGNSD
ncbi:SH3 domain-containing protein [Spirochaeta dissipatitropha]